MTLPKLTRPPRHARAAQHDGRVSLLQRVIDGRAASRNLGRMCATARIQWAVLVAPVVATDILKHAGIVGAVVAVGRHGRLLLCALTVPIMGTLRAYVNNYFRCHIVGG